MHTVIENEKILVTLDNNYPQVLSYTLKATGGVLRGGIEDCGGEVVINGKLCKTESVIERLNGYSVRYSVSIPEISVGFDCFFTLKDNCVYKTIENITGDAPDSGFEITFPTPVLTTTYSSDALAVSSFYIDGGFEKIGKISELGEFSHENCAFAFMWNERIAAGVYTPSATHCPYTAEVTYGKVGNIYPGCYYYRYKDGGLAQYETSDGIVHDNKYTMIVGLVGDLNENGIIDWQDAALWQRSVIPAPSKELMEFLEYGDWRQIHLAFPKAGGDYYSNPVFTIVYATLAQLEETLRRISNLTDGIGKKSYETVGWQGRGHDYGWPDLSEQPFNPAIGNTEYFKSFREKFRKYGSDLSFHINQTDISDYTSCLYRRGGAPHPLGNANIRALHNAYPYNTFGWSGFSLCHYEDFRKGYTFARQDAFIEKYFAPFIMYSDVMVDRPSFGFRSEEEKYAKARNIQHLRAHGVNMATEYYTPEKYLNGQFMFNTYKFPALIDSFMTSGRIQLHNTTGNKNEDLLFGIMVRNYKNTESNWYLDGNGFAEKQAYSLYMYSFYNTFLERQGIREVCDGENFRILKFGDKTIVSYDKSADDYTVTYGETLVADNNKRLIPDLKLRDRAFIYSEADDKIEWNLPDIFDGCGELFLYRMTPNGKMEESVLENVNGKIILELKKECFYILYTERKSLCGTPNYANEAKISSASSEYSPNASFDVSGGMERRFIPHSKSPDGDWRKTIMMLNDKMADDNGIYYNYPCCARTVSDGDENTYWLAIRENGGDTAEINFDFGGYEYNINRIEIETVGCGYSECIVYGSTGNSETELFNGETGNIEFETVKLGKIRIVFKTDGKKELKIKKINIF